jgi:hypothetical protein
MVETRQRDLARRLVQPIVARAQGKSTARAIFLLQLPQPPCEELTLWLTPNQGERLLIRIACLRHPSQPAAQVRPVGVREMVTGEFLAGQRGVDETKI